MQKVAGIGPMPEARSAEMQSKGRHSRISPVDPAQIPPTIPQNSISFSLPFSKISRLT
jgi:hypothetical protein